MTSLKWDGFSHDLELTIVSASSLKSTYNIEGKGKSLRFIIGLKCKYMATLPNLFLKLQILISETYTPNPFL